MNKQNSSSPNKLTFLVIFFVIILSVANLWVSNILATTGERLKLLQSRRENLENQNERLYQQIISLSTLEVIENKAKTLGMLPIETTLNLSPQSPVAMKQP